MYRLLIVDDEDIITDGLYEVFSGHQPERLDVCKAYSAKEALAWMSRTRIDVVLTDIAMPGMNGLELSEEIQKYWPRCRVIFLSGHSEFEFAYRAIQMANVRYVLKTEGYGKVTDTVQDVLDELDRAQIDSLLLEQSREQRLAFQFMAQGDYMRHLLQNSRRICEDTEMLLSEFNKLEIQLDPAQPVVLVLGRISHPEDKSYTERCNILLSVRRIWDSYFSGRARSMGIIDKHGDVFWFLQPSVPAEGGLDNHFDRFVEGTMELIQGSCLSSLGLNIGFTMSREACRWECVSGQYGRLRELQQLRMGSGGAIIVRDGCDALDGLACKESFADGQTAEVLSAYLESGRNDDFLQVLEEVTARALQINGKIQLTIETYYAIALMLHSCIGRMGMHGHIDDTGKLLQLNDHPSIEEAFGYLKRVAESIFLSRQTQERDRASLIADRICQYIEEHLSEDLSLVRLAEIHYFNPSYLSRFFKQEKGINLSDFIDKCRVKKAKEMLRDNDLKVREVALSVGYEAAHSFTRFFKKAAGLTPQEYRDTLALN
ncbi:response regulator transcription factor [Paenibacillus sp. SAF-054]|uniref:response regulator transcription factor n=1 Tax=unclassified Paenibacillus TaxID=185978 RepID=UPI003F7F94E5